MSKLLEAQQSKLSEMREKFDNLILGAPWVGHGGTPFVDNSTGRRRKIQAVKYEESLKSLDTKIKEQIEKINRTENRLAYRSTQTKKSEKFIEKNEINPILFELAELGKVKQWPRNPEYFFVVGLQKVALKTFGEKTGISSRFPAKTQQDYDFCRSLLLSVIKDK